MNGQLSTLNWGYPAGLYQIQYNYSATQNNGQITQEVDNGTQTTTYQYDARANRIATTEATGTASARTTTYQYDAANRYIATTNPLGITTFFVLDADGKECKLEIVRQERRQ